MRGSGQGQGQGRGGSQGSAGGRGRMGGNQAAGPGGNCECPNCGHTVPHQRGKPCYEHKCPECGTQMIRAR